MTPRPSVPVLRTTGLTKRFGGITVLNDVGFDLRAGEIHAICGENGAGKSTLIKLLAGFYPYGSYQGRIEVSGAEARFRSMRDAARAGIAVIHQELACIDDMSVAENIFLGQEPTRWRVCVDRRTAGRGAAALLAQFGVPLDPAAAMRSLGVGQKQLVEIVKALSRESRILILDEPTAALASHEVESLLNILRDLRARGMAMIYISHRLEEVLRVADRISVLRDGAVVASGEAQHWDAATIVRQMVGREVDDSYPGRTVPGGESMLSVRALSVAHEGRLKLREISFELRRGEVLGIGGLMGAGRTELLMHLYGVWGRRAAGRATLDGRTLPSGDPRAVLASGLALVSEDRRRFGLLLDEAVGFNLSLSSLGTLSRAGLVRRHDEAACNRRWFDAVGIRARGLDAVVGGLSGGNQQKVVLGRALMTRPKVVMLDEPTRGIDIGAKWEIYELIRRLTGEGCGVLLVSSEMPELIGLSDRIMVMREGRLGKAFERGAATPEMLLRAALGG